MSLRCASIGYVPPPSFKGAQSFWNNLQANPARHDLILFSDHPWPGVIRIPDPESKECGDLKNAKFPDGKPNRFGIPNAIFFTALRIGIKQGYSHLFFLESDCRVGPQWDERVWNEFWDLPQPCLAAGTLVAQNPCNFSGEAGRRWAALVASTLREQGRALATYGWLGGADRHNSNLFPNGALAVYDLAWMAQLFDLEQTVRGAANETAFDMALGLHVWQRFGVDSFEVLGELRSVYSGYGDVLNSEGERLALLKSGKVCAVHQVKGEV